MEIKKVGVLGCGLMGSGIAQVSATAGFDVTVLEVDQKLLDKGFAGIEKSLAKFAEKGTLKETPQTVRARLKDFFDKGGLAIRIIMRVDNEEQAKKLQSSTSVLCGQMVPETLSWWR